MCDHVKEKHKCTYTVYKEMFTPVLFSPLLLPIHYQTANLRLSEFHVSNNLSIMITFLRKFKTGVTFLREKMTQGEKNPVYVNFV